MSWQNVQSTIRPAEIDTTSSRIYNYVRKDIHEVEVQDEIAGETAIMYEYLEKEVLKEDWETYMSIVDNDIRITDIEDVITEIIGGE